MEHLIKLGHRRIAHLAIQDDRLTGYRDTLTDHDLPYNDDLILTPDPSHILNTELSINAKFLKVKPRPTAIFAANDEIAISAIAALHDQRIDVPGEIAVVSIDNIALARMIRPSLTTVDVLKRRMASFAMQVLMLKKQMDEEQTASIILPTKLIVRESCGANRKEQK